MNIFMEMYYSLWDFEKYADFIRNRKRKVFAFGLVLTLISFICSAAYLVISFNSVTGGLSKAYNDLIPGWELENGRLTVDRVINIDEAGLLVQVDTSTVFPEQHDTELKSRIRNYDSVLLIDSEKMITKDNYEIKTVYFDQFEGSLDKESLKPVITVIKVVIFIAAAAALIFSIIGFFFKAFLIALLGAVIASILKTGLRMEELYRISIYSRTLPVILRTVIFLLPVDIPFMWFFDIGISLLYMTMAMKKIRQSGYQDFSGNGNAQNFGYGSYNRSGFDREDFNINGGVRKEGNPQPDGSENENLYRPQTEKTYSAETGKSDAVSGYPQSYKPQTEKKNIQEPGSIKPSDGWSFGRKEDNNEQ